MNAQIKISNRHISLFYLLCGILLVSVFSAFYLEKKFLIGIPIALAGALMTLVNFRILFYILVFSIPFSFEAYLGGNSFVELPTEPLMILFFFIVIYRPFVTKTWDIKFNTNIISLLIFAQLIWLIPVMFFSTDWILSLKYWLSKNWYVATFMFGTAIITNKFEDIKSLFWLIYSCLIVITLIITYRYAGYGFAFEHMNSPLHPFFINHVIYSTFVATFLPFVWIARTWYNKGSNQRNLLNTSLIFFLFCIATSYTRASWLSIPIAIGVYFLLRLKVLKYVLAIFIIGISITIGWLLHNYKYVEFSPDFEKTIYHRGNIEGHLSATADGTDVSGMERIYRWVSAKNMIKRKPWIGYGTNCFYDNYKKYVVTSFETYVSDNPEKSTTHNYFLMVFAEQGVIGFLLFAALLIAAFLLAEKYYYKIEDKKHRGILMAAILSITIVVFHLFLNDLIETNKIGGLFFISLSLIVKVIVWEKEKSKSKLTA